jgi:hypothetical protein
MKRQEEGLRQKQILFTRVGPLSRGEHGDLPRSGIELTQTWEHWR